MHAQTWKQKNLPLNMMQQHQSASHSYIYYICMHKLENKKLASKYDAATSECFSFVLAMKISQKTDHHSKRKPPGASIASHFGMHNRFRHKTNTKIYQKFNFLGVQILTYRIRRHFPFSLKCFCRVLQVPLN